MPAVRQSLVPAARIVLMLLCALAAVVVAYSLDDVIWPLPSSLHGLPSGVVAFGQVFAPLVILAAAVIIVVVAAGAMVSEQSLRNRYQKGRPEGARGRETRNRHGVASVESEARRALQ